jgi:outer membrane protein assembly factor BamB
MLHNMRLAAVLLAVGLPTILFADNRVTWPQWRGPTRDGLVPAGSPPWPDSLQEPVLTKRWSKEFGPSYSGTIVAEDRVFTTETRDKKTEVTTALSRKDGTILWQHEWPGSMTVPFFAARNGSWIRSTPAYDGKYLYVGGMRDVLVCLDAQTGKEVWRFDFVKEFNAPLPAFGFVCSPLVVGDYVYVQAGASFVKLDKNTGKSIWRTFRDDGGMNGSAFSSPTLAKLQGQEVLLVQGREKLAAIDPADGKVLWARTIPAFRGMNILTPIVYRDGIFTSSYGGKTLLLQIKRNAEDYEVNEAWSQKIEGYMSTPVVIGNHVYMHLKNQRIACLELETGKECWMTPKSYTEYCSFVANGDRILGLTARGTLLLIRATPEKFDLLDSRQVSQQETWAYLAVAGDEIYIRELNALTAWRWANK